MKNIKKVGQPQRRGAFIIKSHNAKPINIEVAYRFGFFIKEASHARNLYDLNKIVERGLPYRSIRHLMNFLEFTTKNIADLTGVSQRTILRWDEDSIIGVLPSKNLVKVDSLIHHGIEVFGSEQAFKSWLQQPNIALGDSAPIDLITTPYGAELIEDAIEAMEYGNVM